MAKEGYKVESNVWGGKRIINLMFGRNPDNKPGEKKVGEKKTGEKKTEKPVKKRATVKKAAKVGDDKGKAIKSSQKVSPLVKKTKKEPFTGTYKEYVSKRLKEGEKDFKVIGKEWQKTKGESDGE